MTSTQRRLLSAVAAAIVLIGSVLLITRTRADEGAPRAAPSPSAAPTLPPAPSTPPDGQGSAVDPEAITRDPDAAATVDPSDLLTAAAALASGDWADLGSDAWPVAERPVYVGTATITQRTAVDSDVVIAFRASQAMDQVVLRYLPASEALTSVGGAPDVRVQRAGRAAPHELDRAGARLIVTLDPPVDAGAAVSLRIRSGYDLVPREQVRDDGGPAGFGLLASNPSVSVLGHWLPLLTFDEGPMIPWGDVGSFPAAFWSLQVEHGDDVLVTGGADGPCPARVGTDGCTWARGLALRDVSGVIYPPAPTLVETRTAGLRVRSVAGSTVPAGQVQVALDESAAGVDVFTQRFGPLAWSEFDVVAAPLSSGAAGMEFPGLVLIRDDTYGALSGGFGTYVIAHEVAHQWFHALLGNGSLSDPVVDESLAQYASVLYYDEVYGPAAGDSLQRNHLDARYERWRSGGGRDEPPGQPLSDFEGSAAYGPLVYARGALAWLAAEDVVGREAVVGFVAGLVQRHGLDGLITDEQLVAEARASDPQLAEVLERYWFDPAPIG